MILELKALSLELSRFIDGCGRQTAVRVSQAPADVVLDGLGALP